MPKKSALTRMMDFVREYLNEERSRLDFDLDFNHYLIENYRKMERESVDIAECFHFYLAEEGFDQSDGLSDSEHKKLIRRQFNEFEAALRDGIF